eukprot:9702825-Lingulodinium_polyedra.AAC.1
MGKPWRWLQQRANHLNCMAVQQKHQPDAFSHIELEDILSELRAPPFPLDDQQQTISNRLADICR